MVALAATSSMSLQNIIIMVTLLFVMSLLNMFPRQMNLFVFLFGFYYFILNFLVNLIDLFWNSLIKDV